MANYNRPILIQKLNLTTEVYEYYFKTHANVNKVGGREYQNASSNISNSSFNFKVRYCSALKDIIFNTEVYRVIYDNRIFDIKNVDRYAENTNELTIIGEYHGKNYTVW